VPKFKDPSFFTNTPSQSLADVDEEKKKVTTMGRMTMMTILMTMMMMKNDN